MENKDNHWLAAHLYYTEPWENFLTMAVEPFVRKVLKKKIASDYFFIRYWERGPHIRLRFKGNKHTLEEKLKPLLIETFEKHYKEHPSAYSSEPEREIALTQKWAPNNSIQFIDYEPEIERYGGIQAIGIAEEHFQSSSTAALSAIIESSEWSYDRAMGVAIQMHLSFANATGMDLKETSLFYSHIFKGWFHRAYYDYNKQMSVEEIKEQRENTLQAFEQNFQQQKEVLIPFHESIWENLKDGNLFEQEWMNTWIKETLEIKNKLCLIQEKGQLYVDPKYKIVTDIEINKENQQRWYIYGSYVHMTNNRLGILNRDEAFLGYLIVRSLQSLLQIKQY